MMQLTQFESMEPALLYSLINMKLRDDYRDLNDLCKSLAISPIALTAKLAEAGFLYDSELNQFRSAESLF
jgi:hypothetical protein